MLAVQTPKWCGTCCTGKTKSGVVKHGWASMPWILPNQCNVYEVCKRGIFTSHIVARNHHGDLDLVQAWLTRFYLLKLSNKNILCFILRFWLRTILICAILVLGVSFRGLLREILLFCLRFSWEVSWAGVISSPPFDFLFFFPFLSLCSFFCHGLWFRILCRFRWTLSFLWFYIGLLLLRLGWNIWFAPS